MDRTRGRLTGPDLWRRRFWLWEGYFGVVWVLVLVAVTVDRSDSGPRRLLAVAGLAAMVPLYAAGRRWLRTRRPAWSETVTWRQGAFLAAVLGLFALTLAGSAAAGFLLFAINPLVFLLLPLRPAVAAVVAANLFPPVAAVLRDGWTGQLWVHLAPLAVVSIAFSIGLGAGSEKVLRQSRRRRELIEELAASRAEVSRLSHQAGVAAERARLAAEIHDTVAQGFTSIIMLLQTVERELGSDPDRARDRLAAAVRTARENLAESRAMIAALAPSALGSGSLTESLRRQVERLGDELSIAVSYQTLGTVRPLPTRVEVVLLRAVQEALANIRRHAHARRVVVRLEYGELVRLVVHDDGRGFDSGRALDGFGLRGMRRRAQQVDGVLAIHSSPEAGTTIELEVPA